MSRVTIKDKTFETSIPEAKILERVKLIADRINKDFKGKTPLFLAVLNGSFMYAADLMTTSRPRMSSFSPITSLIVPVEVVP